MRLLGGGVALFMGCLTLCAGSTGQKKDEAAPPKTDDEEHRLKVAKNVMHVFRKLEQPDRIEQAAQAFFEKERWQRELASFQKMRSAEIRGPGHDLIRTTMPEIMMKLMPKYMQARIMAERKVKKTKGPPSAQEIEKIRADAKAKMKPAMEVTAMSALEKLTKERMDEMLRDEKVLTRAMAERMLKVIILPDAALARFKSDLNKAGYPESLIQGADPILNERVRKMLYSIDIAAVAKEAGL